MTAQYIEAPSKEAPRYRSVFLAGGITNCPDWQKNVTQALERFEVTVLNPRRRKYPEEREALREQIEWEYERLRNAHLVSFWFSSGSVNPITLFELGSALEREVPLVVGTHFQYERKRDLEIQVSLRRPEIKIHESLEDFIGGIKTALHVA